MSASPVRIGTLLFPSQSAAARALGISQPAVWKALEAGDPERLLCPCPHCGKSTRLQPGEPAHG